LQDDSVEEKKKALIAQLKRKQDRLNGADDFIPIQKQLARIVDEIRSIESGYASRIYD
jgi:hypothetical protein